MRIAFVTAGAAGMYCGSCIRDNALVTALQAAGHDAALVPTYTPLTTDEPDVSRGPLFYGGINVYLDQKVPLYRFAPRPLRWLLDRRAVLRLATKRAQTADYAALADLTVSVLRGADGRQKRELDALIGWVRTELRPEAVVLTNALFAGLAPALTAALGVPVVVTLQGDDIYLDGLRPDDKARCVDLIRGHDRHVAGYMATSRYYADYMAGYLGVDRAKIDVVWPGLNLAGHGGPRPARGGRPPTVGYFARIGPEKGFHNLVEAFVRLRKRADAPPARLAASGWLGRQNRPFLAAQVAKLTAANLGGDFTYVESPGLVEKARFLRSVDVLSVPTDYREPKGLYVLEAWANGTPVVQPRHGSFPELVEATGGGLLVDPGDPDALADALARVLTDDKLRGELGRRGEDGVRGRFTAARMAADTVEVLQRYVSPPAPTVAP